MTDGEPDEVRTEVFWVIELSKDDAVAGVHQLDLNDNGLDAEVLKAKNQSCGAVSSS